MKKILCLLMICIFSCSIVTSAQESDLSSNSELLTYIYGNADIAGNVMPMVYTVCGNLSYHRMVSTGIGHVYFEDGSQYIYFGAAWQCENCHLVIVTEGDYYLGQMSTIGKWATSPFDEEVSNNGVVIVGPSSYGVCNSNSMDGYRFYLAP